MKRTTRMTAPTLVAAFQHQRANCAWRQIDPAQPRFKNHETPGTREGSNVEIPNVRSSVASLLKQPDQTGRKVFIEEKLHAERSGS